MPFRSHFSFHRQMFSGRFIGVLHLNQNSAGNQNADIDFSRNIRMGKTNEIVERAGIGNNDHAGDYSAFVGSNRCNAAMSLARSSTV
jgi:hypothetical protein